MTRAQLLSKICDQKDLYVRNDCLMACNKLSDEQLKEQLPKMYHFRNGDTMQVFSSHSLEVAQYKVVDRNMKLFSITKI